jgi:3-mercaptopyruvate sulfurtransferase SseA
MKAFCSFAPRLITALAMLLLPAAAWAGQASAVSADDAHAALVQGAYVIDLRSADSFAAGHLPQAAWLPADAAQRPLPELAALLSQAGIDSSRTLLIVGQPGQPQAQALWQRLAQVASGRVLWLVGGITEWQLTGRSLSTDTQLRHPVPQFLTPFDAPAASARMAGSKVRSSALMEQNLSIKVAANP